MNLPSWLFPGAAERRKRINQLDIEVSGNRSKAYTQLFRIEDFLKDTAFDDMVRRHIALLNNRGDK